MLVFCFEWNGYCYIVDQYNKWVPTLAEYALALPTPKLRKVANVVCVTREHCLHWYFMPALQREILPPNLELPFQVPSTSSSHTTNKQKVHTEQQHLDFQGSCSRGANTRETQQVCFEHLWNRLSRLGSNIPRGQAP